METYSEFRARDFRRIARDKLSGHWGLSLAVTLVATILGAIGGSGAFGNMGNMFTYKLEGGNYSGAIGGAPLEQLEDMVNSFLSNPIVMGALAGALTFGLIVGIALSFVGAATLLGHCQYYVDLCNNQNPTFGVLFSRFRIFWKAVGLRYFMALFIFLWSLLLVVPGIIAVYRYAMAPYLMAQNPEKGIRQCVNESKALMRGHKGRLFCLGLSFIGWALLCLLTLGIGFLWLNPYIYTAEAAFYLDRTGQGIPLNPQPQPQPQQ